MPYIDEVIKDVRNKEIYYTGSMNKNKDFAVEKDRCYAIICAVELRKGCQVF